MVCIPFLLCVILDFPTRKYLSGIDSPKKARVLIWTRKSFFEDFYIKSCNWKRKRSNSNFQVKCEYQTTTNIACLCKVSKVVRKRSNSNFQVECEYQTTTNIAFLCRMVRISFLFCVILDFPPQSTFQVLPKKRLGRVLIWTKKSFFEDFYIKSFNWKRKRSNSNFQVKCEYQTTTNIAFLCKVSKVVRKR